MADMEFEINFMVVNSVYQIMRIRLIFHQDLFSLFSSFTIVLWNPEVQLDL